MVEGEIDESENFDSVQKRALKKLERDLGPTLLGLLKDSRTIEVMLNPDGQVVVEYLGQEMEPICKIAREKAQAIVETVAGFHGREVTSKNSIIECEFPLDNSRFAAEFPPIVAAPSFAIRKKAIKIITLDEYVENGTMTQEQCDVIKKAVAEHKNILVVGGTGSGKTTLVNAIIQEISNQFPNERLIIIEDTGEVQCASWNKVPLHTTLEVNMIDLLTHVLRMRPDRILVGEVRGPETLSLLMAWNTGHPGGVATFHANNSKAALNALVQRISMNKDAPHPIEPLIGEAIQLIVSINKLQDKSRKVTEIIEINGYENGEYLIRKLD